MANAWWMQTQRVTTAAIEAAERFAAKEAALDALIAAGPGGGANFLHQDTQLLEAPAIRGLPSNPLTLVSFPDGSRFIWAQKILLWHEWSADFVGIDPTASIVFDNGKALVGILNESNTDLTNLFAAGATAAYIVNARSKVVSTFTVGTPQLNADMLGSSLVMQCLNGAAGDFTGGGSGTLRITTLYHVYDLSTGLLVAA